MLARPSARHRQRSCGAPTIFVFGVTLSQYVSPSVLLRLGGIRGRLPSPTVPSRPVADSKTVRSGTAGPDGRLPVPVPVVPVVPASGSGSRL